MHTIMTRAWRACGPLLAGIAFLGAPLAGQERVASLTTGDNAGALAPVPFNWNTQNGKPLRVRGQIHKGDELVLKVTGFNFLRYRLKLSVHVDTLRGYAELEQLWKSALVPAPPARGGLARTTPEFLTLLQNWRTAIDASSQRLVAYTGDRLPKSVGLPDDDVATIQALADTLGMDLKALEVARSAVYAALIPVTGAPDASAVEAYYRQELYKAELARSEELAGKLAAFRKLAGYCAGGQLVTVGRFEAGNIVTATLTVEAADAADAARAAAAQPTTIKYLVSSSLPVFFHAGPVYSNISNVTVDKVQAVNQGDVYKEVTNPKSTAELAVFLGYALAYNADGEPSILVSLGSDLTRLGNRLYLGLTGNFKQVWLTGGISTQAVKEGENLLQGDLFQTFSRKQKFGFFLGATVSPF